MLSLQEKEGRSGPLTFNRGGTSHPAVPACRHAHRIHYESRVRKECRRGYLGLLAHGALQKLAMAEAARAARYVAGRLTFEYRLTSPLFDGRGMVVSVAREQGVVMTAVRGIYGWQTATGTLRNTSYVAQVPGGSAGAARWIRFAAQI